ncbi:MAG: hypothetical protein ACR2NJ_03865 [Acidimicrobiales bacterium]
MSLVGLVTLLAAAWGAVSVFIGPLFDYRPTSSSSWDWTTANWLLHLVPGAVGFLAGIMILGSTPRTKAITRGTFGLAGLLAVAAGAWFVIGPALWPTFESTSPYGAATSAGASFVNQLGANLGPGLFLAAFGGMALKSLTRDRTVEVPPEPAPVPAPAVAAATAPHGEAAAPSGYAPPPASTAPAATEGSPPASTAPAATEGSPPASTAPGATEERGFSASDPARAPERPV